MVDNQDFGHFAPGSNLAEMSPSTTTSHEHSNIEQDTESASLAVILGKNKFQNETESTKLELETAPIADGADTNIFPDKEALSLTEVNTNTESHISKQEGTVPTCFQAKNEAEICTIEQTTPLQRTTNVKEQPTAQKIKLEISKLDQTLTEEHQMHDTVDSSSQWTSTSRQDSTESTDVYQTSSDLLDSHEDEQSNTPADSKNLKSLPKEHHVPLLSDTWSGRSLPTSQTIEHLAISRKYIFCIDSRSRVYFSDPNSTSCSGWEKADFKAKQIFVNPSCDFVAYVEHRKAFIRGNISDINPVGNVSFQILDEVSLLSSCCTCTWALTAGNTLRRTDTAGLARVKCDIKAGSYWKIVDSHESLDQIACYDHALWARTHDETVLVYRGK